MVIEIPDQLIKDSERVQALVAELQQLITETKAHTEFDLLAIYQAHPWKVGKKPGLKRLAQKIKNQATYDLAMNHAKRLADKAAREGKQFIPRFITWVSQERWLDDEEDGGSDVITNRQTGI
jgi:hypothetical protein